MTSNITSRQIKKILIITHEASLSGAPILLLRLMRLLKANGYTLNTLIVQDGPLHNDFAEISEQCVLYKRSSQKNVRERIKVKVFGEEDIYKKLLTGVDCIFNNTIVNGRVLKEIKAVYDIPVITYIHELNTVTAITTNKETLNSVLLYSNSFLTPCKAVEEFIITSLKVKAYKTAQLNYFIPQTNHIQTSDVTVFKAKHNISASFIAGSLGTMEWRKGADVFLQVVSCFFSKQPSADTQFIWMGSYSEQERLKFLHDAQKLNVLDKIILLPSAEDVEIFWNMTNVLLLPSREDPYPVVVLEAAAHKIPTVCFRNAGGASEFIIDDAGITVSYLDIEAMTEALVNYYHERSLLQKHGEFAFQRVKKIHGNPELVIEQFRGALTKLSS
jgi:glycosyltransferase involved in cell wall biosynthesis